MKVYLLSDRPVQTIIALDSGEFLLQTNDQTRLVQRDLGNLSEKLAEAPQELAYVAVREARGAVASALKTALYREQALLELV